MAGPDAPPRPGATRVHRGGAWITWASIGLAVAMEAAWISVAAGLVQEFTLHDAVIELPGMAALVVLGMGAARLGIARLPARWPVIGTLLVFAAAAIGVAASADARAALGAGHITQALADHPGGPLAGLAVLRGYAHAGPRPDVDAAGRAILLGVPALAIAAAAGGMVIEPFRSGYLATAGVYTVVFIAAGLLTFALAALAAVRPTGASWGPSTASIFLGVGAVATLLAIALPIGAAGGPRIVLALQVIVAGSIIPLAVVGVVLGGRVGLRRMAIIFAVTAVIAWILSLATGKPELDTQPGSGGGDSSTLTRVMDPAGVVGVGGLALLLVGLGVFFLIRAWMRRRDPLPGGVEDERSSVLPGLLPESPAMRRHHRRPWTRQPQTAAEAYLWLVEDIAAQPDIRRRPAETPSEHARRVRAELPTAGSGIRLEFLAADYGLASYAERSISRAETRRAIGRWRILRRRLRDRPSGPPTPPPTR